MKKTIVIVLESNNGENDKKLLGRIKSIHKKMGYRVYKLLMYNFDSNLLKKERLFVLSFLREVKVLTYSEIIFFEKVKRKMIVHTAKRNYEFYETRESVVDRLDLDMFVIPHKSFIVNRNKIIEVGKDYLLVRDSGQIIPISKRIKKELEI